MSVMSEFPERCVHERFAARAAACPDAAALTWAGGTMSYGELNGRANRLARFLTTLGVGPDAVVGICLDRSPELLVAMLGVLKAGGAYMPMDPAYPSTRLAYMAGQSGAKVILTDSRRVAGLSGHGAPVVDLDGERERIGRASDRDPAPRATVRNLAYVIYTSGSTGTPKGVEIEHGSLLNLVTWFQSEHGLTPADRVTFVSGIGFDASVSEIWPCLAGGACLCLPEEEARLAPPQLRDWLVANRVTVAFAPTPLAENLLSLTWPPETALRWVYAGGDELRRFPPEGLPFQLGNAYGPTECTCIATYAVIPPGPRAGKPSIGRPVTNARALLLDPQMQPVPEGEPGELYIAGPIVGRGYRNRPDLTAERFIESEYGRLYQTGDLARWMPDGSLEFLGRRDGQVKIRGFRIELGEIETSLLSHQSVSEAVVTVQEDDRGEKRLIAYVVPRDGAPAPDGRMLREHLAARLPVYMLPAAFVTLAALPLTPNGKVDRKALPMPDEASLRAEYIAPGTETETALARLWSEVLGLERIGVADDFFLLGGHSLLATQLISRIRDRFGVEITAAQFFAASTVAGLATLIETGSKGAGPLIRPTAGAGRLPLSFAQERLWFFDQLEKESPLYNIAEAIRLEGALDTDALRRALNAVVERHEALRTNFVVEGAVPVQVIVPAWPVPLPVVDLTHLPAAEAAAEAARLSHEEARRPFDLTRDPLLRAILLRLAPADHLLLLTIHHIVYDGWSAGLLYHELGKAYLGEPLPPLPLQYADFSLWQREWLAGGALAEQLAYWSHALAGVPTVLELPTDRPRPAVQSFAGARCTRTLPAELVDRLQGVGRREGATLFMTLLAAYQALLHRYCGQEQFLVGAPIANRNRAEIEPIIGFFVNTLALPADLRGAPTFRELLSRVRTQTLDAFAHQDLPLEKLVEVLQPDRDRSRPPLVQTLFVLQNAPMEELKLPGIRVTNTEPTGVETGTAKYDLVVTVEEAGGTYRVVAEYATALYDAETVGRLLGHFERLLQSIAADPDRAVATLPLLPSGEERLLLRDWAGAASDYPRTTIHALFAEQARLHPSSPAVVFGAERLTYAELDRRSNRLASRLRRAGVGPDVLVGLCLERSPLLIVALLSILKAGGAYLPLATDYPADRLAFMLEDGQAPVLLTQASLIDRLPPTGAEVIVLDRDWAEIAAEPDTAPAAAADTRGPDDLAYVCYTSGSTGRPKGVLVPHRAVVRLVRKNHFADLTADDVFLQMAPVSFDASTLEIWGALLNGARLVVMPPQQPSLDELAQALTEHQVSVLWLTAGLFHLMVEHQLEALLQVRQVLAGGDVLSVPHVRRMLDALKPGHRLINGYGPTENTTFTCCFPMTRETVISNSVPIGRPIASTTCYVLGRHLEPVPEGVPGELYTGGDGLARGYLNRPELTAERFVETPYGRLYRTGDLVRWLSDGTIEFLGRTDNQVKIRGFRIELGEIETALLAHPDVTGAVVLARDEGAAGKRLVAYLTGSVPEAAELRAYLKERLPEYMIPSATVTLSEFPLNPNGKVDRRALPAPELEADRAYAAPQTDVEQQLAAIWAEVLEVPQVGLTDDFFELGGHSLTATRLIYRVREQLGVDLPLRALFEAPVLGALAARVTETLGAAPAPAAMPFDPALLDAETARLWLDRLDELTDEQVDVLLSVIATKEDAE